MPDQSHLDDRYFIDQHVYNCPFCNRRNVSYNVVSHTSFDWTEEKPCYGYLVKCSSCENTSFHLSFTEIYTQGLTRGGYRFDLEDDGVLDDLFFYSVPTSFFALDSNVPIKLREVLTEAEGCLKMNFLTGASACARKMIYELALLSGASGEHYDERIKSLKAKHPDVEPTFFDSLLTIQKLTSKKVHEDAYDGWESRHLRVMLTALHDILNEIYVLPALRKDKREGILALEKELVPEASEAKPHNSENENGND